MKKLRGLLIGALLLIGCGDMDFGESVEAITRTWLIGNTSYVNGTTITPIKAQSFWAQLPPLPLNASGYSSIFGNFAIGNPSGSNYINLQFWRSGSQYVGTVSTNSDDGAGGTWPCPNCTSIGAAPGQILYWEWNSNTVSNNFRIEARDALDHPIAGQVVYLSLGFAHGAPLSIVYSPQVQFGAASALDCKHDFPGPNDGGNDCYFPTRSNYGIGASANLFVPFTTPRSQPVCGLHVTNASTFADMEWEL